MPIVNATTPIATAMITKTPVGPYALSAAAMRKPMKIELKRLQL